MTCIEKLKQEHPEWDAEKIKEVILRKCPLSYGYYTNTSMCRVWGRKGSIAEDCPECWEQECMNVTH